MSNYLATRPDGQTDENGGHSDARYERDAHWRAYQRAQLPQDFFLARPWLFAPECAARGRQVVQIADFFHAEPAEFAAAHRARDMIAGAVVHFDDERLTFRTPFYLLF